MSLLTLSKTVQDAIQTMVYNAEKYAPSSQAVEITSIQTKLALK